MIASISYAVTSLLVLKPMSEASSFPVRDDIYFLEPIFIRVEDTMFQVPKHYFMDINIFSTIFSLPPPLNENGAEGLTEKLPFTLHQIAKHDFQCFLKVLMPLRIPYAYSEIETDEWISTLKLSTMWDIAVLRDLAISYLTPRLNLVEKILLGSEYHISEWFISGCAALIKKSPGPTEEEGELLGIRLTVGIYRIRERLLFSRRHGLPQFDIQHAVREAFSDQIYS